jgi:hypothetical protein
MKSIIRIFPNPINQRSWLVIILLISVVLRLAVAIYFGDQVVDLPGTADQISYHNLAIRVVEGYGFSFGQNWWPATLAGSPTAHWSFLYTLYLVIIYGIFGIHPILARLIQAFVVGLLQPYLTYRIGRECFNDRVGLIAGTISAVYVYFFYYAGTLMTEPFYIVLILAAILVSIILAKKKQVYRFRSEWTIFGLLGLILGCVVLLRQLFLVFIPFIFIWIFWARQNKKFWHIIGRIALVSGIILAMILPFTIYNYLRFNRFVFLNTNSGYAFFFGNNPIYGSKFVPILTEDMGSYQKLIPSELLGLDEAVMDQELLKRGVQFVVDDPGRYILLSISRIPVYFEFWPTGDSSLISNISRVASFGIFLPFMIYGLILAGLKGSYARFSNPGWLLIIFIVTYSGIHLLSWALIRYRLPIDAVLVVFGALAFENIFSWFWDRRRIAERLADAN